jgi:hypothetical protein
VNFNWIEFTLIGFLGLTKTTPKQKSFFFF